MPDTDSEVNVTGLTQQSYKGTEYSDQSWEVIGELPDSGTFEPLEIEVLPQTGVRTDPMFADYGGGMNTESIGAENRWQLPDLSKRKGRGAKVIDEIDENEIVYTEEQMLKLVAEAEDRGRVVALEEATMLQNEKMGKIEEGMNTILQDIHKQLVENIAEVEKYAVDLTLAISEKLLNHVVEIQPEYIVSVINEAIRLCGSANVSKVRVSPQDMEFIEIVGLAKQFKQPDSFWKFEADPSIRAGCVIDTSAGEVDYQLDKAFARIQENVIKAKK